MNNGYITITIPIQFHNLPEDIELSEALTAQGNKSMAPGSRSRGNNYEWVYLVQSNEVFKPLLPSISKKPLGPT
jgi:hypothetical protein